MTLHDVIDTVIDSSTDDWHKIVCWGANSGPSYHSRFTFYDTWEGQQGILSEDSHSNVAIYIPDVSITLGFGLKSLDNFQEPWANNFPDPHASSSYVDIFYNKTLVFRDLYVVVDGGRSYLPLPKRRDALEVPRRRHDFIRLVDSLSGAVSDFDDYFERAKFQIVDDPWPEL